MNLFCFVGIIKGGCEFYFYDEKEVCLKKLKKPWFTLTYSSVQSGPASYALHEQLTFA